MAQLSSQMLQRRPYKSSFLRARRRRSASGQPVLLIWMRMGIWSLIRAHSLTMPQKLTFLYKFGDINVRLITLSYSPLFHIGSPLSVASIRPLALVSASRRSAYSLLAIYFPPHIRQQALKSPKSITSPLASLIAVFTLGHVLI